MASCCQDVLLVKALTGCYLVNRLIKSMWNIAMCVTIDYMCSYMTKRKAVASLLLPRSCTAQGLPASFEISSEAAPDSRCAGRKPGFKHVMTCPEHIAFLRVELACKPRWDGLQDALCLFEKKIWVYTLHTYACTHTFLARRTTVDGTTGSMGKAWSSLCFLCKI